MISFEKTASSSSCTKSKMKLSGIYLFLVLRLKLSEVKSRIVSRTRLRTSCYVVFGEAWPNRIWFSGIFVLNSVSISSRFISG